MSYPTLYKLTSGGKLQEWTISCVHYPQLPGQPSEIVTVYGLTDGKKQTAIEKIKGGKNIGKANETTMIEQAELEARAQWEAKKKNKGYVESIEAAKGGERDASVAGGIDPMLAHVYDKQKAKITWPAYVQPKLNGHRCIAQIKDGVCKLWSRQRNLITGLPHINAELEKLFPNETVTLDGELYNHDYHDNLEALTSFIRNEKPKRGHEIVQYWVYDVVNDDPFSERNPWKSLDGQRGYIVLLVPTALVDDEASMIKTFGNYIELGFEGLMVRNENSRYKNSRSYDLQKVKIFQDAEFEIVDVVPGTGKMSDKGVFVCITGDGQEFKAKKKGALNDLKKYLENKDDYIGKKLTVQYQALSQKGIPLFPVGLQVREDV